MDSKTSRSSLPRAPRHRLIGWVMIVTGLLLISALASWFADDRSIIDLRYGEFKKRLAAHEIRSVKVGVTELTGELQFAGPDVKPVRFRASRVGMEHDEE